MRLRDVTRTYGTAVMHVWPPQVLAQSGTTFIRPDEGVLKSVRRVGNRLSLTVEHDGREAIGGVELSPDERPSLETVEKLLRANLGKPVQAIGDLDV
ncbi:MAG: hypothetical protein ACRDGM_11695 [bacterium]